jgi:hypothetical protein
MAGEDKRTRRGAIWRWIIFVLMVPVILAMAVCLPRWLSNEIKPVYFHGVKKTAVFFFSGAGIYILMHIFLHRPVKAYVFAHNLAHSIWSKLTGHKIKRVKVDEKTGQSITEGGNFFVRLMPYCIPCYTMLVIVVWVVLQFIFPVMSRHTAVLYGAIGFTYAMHVLMTLHFMKVGQSDLHAENYCFSLSVILFFNFQIAVALLSTMAHRSSWWKYQVAVYDCLSSWADYLVKLFP